MAAEERDPMLRLLVDTCVWLDVAKDHRQENTLSVLEELIRLGEASLIVPTIVLTEFARHKARIVEESRRSLSAVFKRVKEAVDQFGDPTTKGSVLQHLNEVDHQLPLLGEAAARSVVRIEKLLSAAVPVPASDTIKLRAAERALAGRAPFHRQRNGMGDSVIIETYAECLASERARGTRFAFVTHNTNDFSNPAGDTRRPHPHLENLFSKRRSLYFINLAEALKRLRPAMVTELMLEYEGWDQRPRSLSEVLDAIDELVTKVWYNRHLVLREKVMLGKVKIVDRAEAARQKFSDKVIVRDVWEGALRSAKKVEQRFGRENLGPYSDFDWGMMNGKLSALRWFLGEEWDELYT
jgi:predicted nucleic acid-binding protein